MMNSGFVYYVCKMLLILTPLIVLIPAFVDIISRYQKMMRHESFNTCEQL